MKNKLYIALFISLAVLTFSFSYTFATNNIAVVDGIRNVVGGAENVIEDAGNGIASGVKNVTSAGQNTIENMSNKTMQGTTTDSSTYTATRTATDTTSATFLGMNSTVWTWIIMAIVGIAIIALVWMYAKQNENSYNDYK